MKAHVLSVGTELITGQVVDTNAAWLSAGLAARGVDVVARSTCGDDLAMMVSEIERMARIADLALITGGLGPTEDDLTREALARALGVALVMDEDALENLRRFFQERGREMPPSNQVQAQVPAGARALENACGTAPGIQARLGGCVMYALPGVPREMRQMFERCVLPHLPADGGGRAVAAASFHTAGTTESELGERIRDMMARGRNPTVGTTAREGIISIHIRAAGPQPDAARTLLERDASELERRLGSLVFGRDETTLASAVAGLLVARDATVTTAESCTGGLVATWLTDVPGSSAYFQQGVVTYADEAKTRLLGVPASLIRAHGAVSPEVAEAMARGARERAGADYGLSLTGIAGPTGGTQEKPVGLVHLGLATAYGVDLHTLRFGPHQPRLEIRTRSAVAALNQLRLKLMG